MMSVSFGQINVLEFLEASIGKVTGQVLTDAKIRWYEAQYEWVEAGGLLQIWKVTSPNNSFFMPKVIELDFAMTSFFGLYSGDGSKGVDDRSDPSRIRPNISFSQRERTLVKFALNCFEKIFPRGVNFSFTLGEDSAYFMAGQGLERLEAFYLARGETEWATPKKLTEVRAHLDSADNRYLGEVREGIAGSSEEHLAFYYQHKDAMENILAQEKAADLAAAGIQLGPHLKAVASLRRPFKKGAREMGRSSRSDELQMTGVGPAGELFLKIMHSIEASLASDLESSDYGLVTWTAKPSTLGHEIKTQDFFATSPWGQINNSRPAFEPSSPGWIVGRFPAASEVKLKQNLKLNLLWAYVSGLYLAEGSTPKSELFTMFTGPLRSPALGFTSSEGTSIELLLRVLRSIFDADKVVTSWKVKVGNQYFPELVVVGIKNAVPMLRGGNSGDGKLRTMEISLAIKSWALEVASSDLPNVSLLASEYAEKFSHVEPTGAGVARIDVTASAALCRWFFPIMMFCVFQELVSDPTTGFQL
jgi:hypothetical protein